MLELIVRRQEVNLTGTEFIVVLVTIGEAQAGQNLARALVEEHLAACVQIIPGGLAVYRWQGTLYQEAQVQLLIKTRRSLFDELQSRILALHGDKVPEILALPVVGGLAAYLDWMASETETQ